MLPSRNIVRVLTGVVLVGLLVTGCAGEQHRPSASSAHQGHGGDSDGTNDEHDDGGHAMSTIPEPAESADWNAVDANYLTMMIGHHRQALDLAELAETRAQDPRVRLISESIDAGQGREIIVMATWLVDHDLPEPTLDDVTAMTEMGGMPGMLSVAQVDALAATDGAGFDRRFLEDMIQHHQGAVGMAEAVVATGEDVRVVDMATEVIAGQNAEIARMRQLLEQLP